jgi:hypothetical protein
MRIPQTPERIKEAPAQALRAVFAGVGQVLLMTERIRRRAMGQEHSQAVSSGASVTRDEQAPARDTGAGTATQGADQADQVKTGGAGTSSAGTSAAAMGTAPASAAKAGTAKAGTAKAGTAKASTAKAGTAKSSTAKASAAKTGRAKAEPVKAEPAKAKSAKASAKAGTVKAAATEAGTAQTGTAEASPARPGAATKPGSAKADSAPATSEKPKKTATPAQPGTATPAEAATPAPAEAHRTSVLPVPHYSELSVASLRARLRGLDIAQIRDLLTYERTHEDRANVIAMFERRIAKLEEAEGAGPATG